MRNSFYEYYGLSTAELDKLWQDGLIVFDTNVFLSLYRRPKDVREDIISVIKSFKDRIWLPHQVGYEYHENRLEKAYVPIDALNALTERFSQFEKEIKKDYESNPFVDYKKIQNVLKSQCTKIEKMVEEWAKNCPDYMKEDKILETISALFDGKVGSGYNETKLLEIYKLGEKRYAGKIPPGYRDVSKPTERQRYGDLIIWLQIIDEVKKSDKDIIFVTDDGKEDWWEEFKSNKRGPRRELIREFRLETGNHLIWFYTPERFLANAKAKIGVPVKPKTIEEVKRPEVDWPLIWGTQPGQISVGAVASHPFISLDESDNHFSIFSSLHKSPSDSLKLAASDYNPGAPLDASSIYRFIKTSPVSGLTGSVSIKADSESSDKSSSKDDNVDKGNIIDNQAE